MANLLVLLVPIVPHGAATSTRAQSAVASSAAPAAGVTKLALLVGINNYKYPERISPLAGSLNDVEDMRQVLITKFEFPPENITVLKDSEATHAAIIQAIQNDLLAKAKAGDIVVFHYSGHGSQMKDVTGKMISGLDETIVPYDSRDPQGTVFDISGAELHPLLVALAAKTKNLTFILDSCHSGTLVRGARERSIPADTRTPPPLPVYSNQATRGLGGATGEPPPSFAAISAASSKESAFEHFTEGKDHGALTYFLTRQLRNAKPGATYRDIMDGVIGNVTANYPAQHPSLEGAEADQLVFGDASSLTRSYVRVTPLEGRSVSLDTGQIEGATVGSMYEVYPPGSRKFAPPEKSVARVQLTSVDSSSSVATIVGAGTIAAESRAVERNHHYANLKMRVYFDSIQSSPALQSIALALLTVKYVETVDKPTSCNMQVRQAEGKIQTLAADQSTLSTPISANDPAAVARVVEQIKAWAKWFNVLSIHNASSELELKFSLKGSQTRDPMARVGRPDMGVFAGETVDATLTNNSDRDVYVAILDLSSDGSVSVVYPPDLGAKQVLTEGSSLTRTFTTFVPKGRATVTDILKVFASYKPIDLSPLAQGTIRSVAESPGESDPLEELLIDSTDGTRGIVATTPMSLGGWATVQRVLVVKRKS